MNPGGAVYIVCKQDQKFSSCKRGSRRKHEFPGSIGVVREAYSRQIDSAPPLIVKFDNIRIGAFVGDRTVVFGEHFTDYKSGESGVNGPAARLGNVGEPHRCESSALDINSVGAVRKIVEKNSCCSYGWSPRGQTPGISDIECLTPWTVVDTVAVAEDTRSSDSEFCRSGGGNDRGLSRDLELIRNESTQVATKRARSEGW